MTELELKYLIALQPKIREAMGGLRYGDWCIVDVGHGIGREELVWQIGMDDSDEVIRIPAALPLPGQEVGRTLIGMLDGLESITFFKTSAAEVYRVQVQRVVNNTRVYDGGTPYLALLRALAAQWKVEVPT